MLTPILGHDPGSSVLFVTNDFPPREGGIQTFVRQLCDELPPEQVVVYAPAHPEAARYDARLPFAVVRDARPMLLPTPRVARRVEATIERHRCSSVVYGSSVPLGLLAQRLRASGHVHRQVALTHGHEVWWAAVPGPRHVLRWVAGHVEAITYVSDFTGRRLKRWVGKGYPWVKLSPGVGPEFHPDVDGAEVRRQLGIDADVPVVVCVARLVPRKGQDRLIRIWPRVLEMFPRAHLLLVGDGRDRARLERMVARRHLQHHVTLTGRVPHTPPYYAAGDVFAMPVRSRWFGLEVEGFGISYLEAAAVGLRVIPGKEGGAPEAAGRTSGPT